MVLRLRCAAVNCYLVRGGGGSVLVDAGNRSDYRRLSRALRGEPLRLIILTHAHPDHIGAAAALSRESGAPLAMGADEGGQLSNPSDKRLRAHTALGVLLSVAANMTMRRKESAPPPIDIWLRDGQSLSDFGVDARVMALPGHTAGSIGVLTGEGELIAGDAAFNIFKPTGPRLYEDRAGAEDSLRKIIDSGAKTVYVGHGGPLDLERGLKISV